MGKRAALERGSPAGHSHARRVFEATAARLAGRLRRLRASRGWTQRAAASKIGIGAAVVRRLECGSANPSLAVLISVARAFGVSLTKLLGR
jgi:transcriptional regulator with XRE-family HTH domain